MSLRVTFTSEVKVFSTGSVAKASLNRASFISFEMKAHLCVIVSSSRRETVRSTHGQVEAVVTHSGGPNPLTLKSLGMTCG